MNFKVVSLEQVLNYIKKYSIEAKDFDKRVNLLTRLTEIEKKVFKPFLAFQNEYGENYLVILDKKGSPHWCGDESDWEYAKSFYEDQFMYEIVAVEKAKIVKDKKV